MINSQAKGKRAERDLANWWKYHGYPDAARAVKTGDRFTADAGDLILEWGSFRLVVEVKHHAGGLTDGQVDAFGHKLLTQTAQAKGNLGILVERRNGVTDPGRWWAYVPARAFAILQLGLRTTITAPAYWSPARVPVAHLAALLQASGLAAVGQPVVSSALSAPRGSGTMAETVELGGGS